MSEPSASDRRVHERHDLALPVRVSAADGDAEVEAQSVNISEGGVLIAGTDFPDGALVRLEIELAEMGWHALDARVVRRDPAPGGGEALAASFASAATEGGREAIRFFFAARLGSGGPAA